MKISIIPMDKVLGSRNLVSTLRNLTIRKGAFPLSGMNKLLNQFIETKKTRSVNALAIIARESRIAVGWAILAEESTEFCSTSFDKSQGLLFEVFVNPEKRRLGIGSQILDTAKLIAGPKKIYVVPWDDRSRNFYSNTNGNRLQRIIL